MRQIRDLLVGAALIAVLAAVVIGSTMLRQYVSQEEKPSQDYSTTRSLVLNGPGVLEPTE